MAPDAPLLHDDHVHARRRAAAAQALQHRQARRASSSAIVAAGFAKADVVVEREFRTAAGAPGLHRAARVPRERLRRRRRRSSGARPRASSSCAASAPSCSSMDVVEAERDCRPRSAAASAARRRLSRAARRHAVAEGRPAGEDGDDARRGVPRHRTDVRLAHQGQDGRDEGRHGSSPAGDARYEAGAFPGSRCRGCDVPVFTRYDLANVLIVGIRRRRQPAEGRSLPRARRTDGRIRRRDGRSTRSRRSSASIRSSSG